MKMAAETGGAVGRRTFLAGAISAGAFAATGSLAAFAKPAGRPLMRLGMIADTHLHVKDDGTKLQNCLCLEPALRYFDSRRADGVLVAGDLTDIGTVAGLRHFAAIWDKVFPGGRRSDGGEIKLLHIFGDHDMGGYMHKFAWAPKEEVASGVIPDTDVSVLWEDCFHEKWSPIQIKECCGYRFVLAHHPRHNAESDNGDSIPGLAEFMSKQMFDPGKPFFFVQHRIFKGTACGPDCPDWESGKTTEILRRHPNAIAVCGHGHFNAADELCLWQGEFTALQIPSLNYCCTRAGRENGYNPADRNAIMPKGEIRKSWQGMFGTMYADRFVVERRDFLNGQPLAPDWVIPVPCADGSLGLETRKSKAAPPRFSAGAAVAVSERTVVNRAGVRTDAAVVSFPAAHATARTPRAYDYAVAAIRDGAAIKEKFAFSKGQFWADETDTQPVECAFAKGDLPPDWRESVKFSVAPRDSFGNRGRAIES